ncbi:MAG: lysophospholipid acyltransferase family protein [Parvularculaceae bacterium]
MPLNRALKRLASSNLVRRLASVAIGLYVRFVDRTTRWNYVGVDLAAPLLEGADGFFVAVWHQRLMMGALLRRRTRKRVFMLVSSHRDGEIMANAIKGYGVEFIRGSAANPRKMQKEKGGASAIADMVSAVRNGHIVCVTPDGPRGPSRKAQAGLVRLAQMSGAPILPSTNSLSRGWRLKTWDRFFLPGPFSRGCFAVGTPIIAPKESGLEAIEAARLRLEETLNEITVAADADVGRSPEDGALG